LTLKKTLSKTLKKTSYYDRLELINIVLFWHLPVTGMPQPEELTIQGAGELFQTDGMGFGDTPFL